MGLEEKLPKSRVQLQKTLTTLAIAYIEICKLHKILTDDPKQKEICDKGVKTAKRFIKLVENIKHTDIMWSIYKTFINGKESLFTLMLATSIRKDTVKHWDSTEKGYKEFVEMEETAKKEYEKELEEQKKKAEMLKKAKEEGKKVEYVMKNGKLEPTIVEEKPN